MANFCGICGYALDPATGTCPNCNPASAVAETKAKNKSDKPKSKKKILIPIIAAVLVLALLAGGAVFLLPKILGSNEFITTGRDRFMFTNEYGTYYSSSIGLISTENSDDLAPLLFTDTEREVPFHSDIDIYGTSFVAVGNVIYMYNPEVDQNYHKLEFVDGNTVKDEIWISEDEYDKFPRGSYSSYYWTYSEGYIYMTSNNYILTRINIDTQKVEAVSKDAVVESYVIDDEWVYYYNNGFVREDGFYKGNYSKSEAGIYRMKLDGSNVEKIMDFPTNASDEYWDSHFHNAFTNLGIYKDKLYFSDNTDLEDCRIYCMDLDGNNVKQISDKSTFDYTIDPHTDKLYYVTGNYYFGNSEESNQIYEVSLKDYETNKIAECGDPYYRINLTAKDGKLYLHFDIWYDYEWSETSEDKQNLLGLYIDTKKNEINSLSAYCSTETKLIDGGRGTSYTQTIFEDIFYSWREYDGYKLMLK